MPVKEYLTPKETSLIEDAADNLRDKLFIRLLRRLACRLGEVLGIEEKHINFTLHQIKIEHEKILIGLSCPICSENGIKVRIGKKHEFCPKCGIPVKNAVEKKKAIRHLRKIPVDRNTLELLREYIDRGGVKEVNGRRMLFTFSQQWARQIVRKCAERAGFYELENPENERRHHVHPHSFRDSWAINAIKKKPTADDLRLVQEMLGHRSYDTTMRYRKVAIDELHSFYNELLEEEK